MNIDTWHQWPFLRPLFLVVTVTALLAAASLIRWYNAWRDTGRGKNGRQRKSAIPSHGTA
jgi:hypothetical protein